MPLSSLLRTSRTPPPQASKVTHPPRELFSFLNTSLGTWVLSAVFLTLGPFMWQTFEAHFARRSAEEAESYRRSRLIEEFAYRLSLSQSRLTSLIARNQPPGSTGPDVSWALAPLLGTNESGLPLFQENRELSAVSVLAEINVSLINSESARVLGRDALVRHLRKRIDALPKLSGSSQHPSPFAATAAAAQEFLRSEIEHPLWSCSGFSHLTPPEPTQCTAIGQSLHAP